MPGGGTPWKRCTRAVRRLERVVVYSRRADCNCDTTKKRGLARIPVRNRAVRCQTTGQNCRIPLPEHCAAAGQRVCRQRCEPQIQQRSRNNLRRCKQTLKYTLLRLDNDSKANGGGDDGGDAVAVPQADGRLEPGNLSTSLPISTAWTKSQSPAAEIA